MYLKIVVMRILHPSNDWCHRQRKYYTLIEENCFILVLILALCWIFWLEMRVLQSFAIFATSSPLQRSWHLLENAFILQQPLEYLTFQIIYQDLVLTQQRRNISFLMSLIMRFWTHVANTQCQLCKRLMDQLFLFPLVWSDLRKVFYNGFDK